jgi:hypothetical protein
VTYQNISGKNMGKEDEQKVRLRKQQIVMFGAQMRDIKMSSKKSK